MKLQDLIDKMPDGTTSFHLTLEEELDVGFCTITKGNRVSLFRDEDGTYFNFPGITIRIVPWPVVTGV